MARGRAKGIVIAGGGVAGAMAALAMAKLRPEVPVLLVEESARFGGGAGSLLHVEQGLDDAARALIEPLVVQRWDGFFTAFPGASRKRRIALAEARSDQLHAEVVQTLRADQYRLNTRVVAVREDGLLLQGGEDIKAEGAFDARGAANLSLLDIGWRVEARCAIDLERPHQVDRPVLIDALLPDFVYSVTPEGPERIALACWRYGPSAEASGTADGVGGGAADGAAAARLADYAALRGWRGRMGPVTRRARPVPTGGDFGGFWRIGGARVAKIGMRGGFFHPMLGWTLADAAETALLLSRQRDFSGAALHDAFAEAAAAKWKKRAALREANAALLAEKDGGRAGLERIFALGQGTLGAFLADDLGLLDRRRVLAAARG